MNFIYSIIYYNKTYLFEFMKKPFDIKKYIGPVESFNLIINTNSQFWYYQQVFQKKNHQKSSKIIKYKLNPSKNSH